MGEGLHHNAARPDGKDLGEGIIAGMLRGSGKDGDAVARGE
jgi:hypothetical protein